MPVEISPNANLRGEYLFTEGELEGLSLVFDFRSNGANVVLFELR